MEQARLRRRLTAIASRLDKLDTERDALYAERLKLWRESGLRPFELAPLSRVKAVTVRSLLAKDGDGA